MNSVTPSGVFAARNCADFDGFDAAHELGHLVLHSEHRLPQGPDAEQEANRFAAAFLMPRAAVLAQHLTDATADQILAAKHTWRVSAMALTTGCTNST